MRISLLVSSLRCGGAERIAALLANAWAARGDAVQVLTLDSPREQPFYPLSPEVEYSALGLRADSRSFLESVYQLVRRSLVVRRAIRSWEPHIVVAFMENLYAVLATRGLGVPVIISERGLPEKRARQDFAWKHLVPRLYPRAQALVIPSRGMSEWYREHLGMRCTIIPNPVLPASATRDTAGGGERILSAGRLSPEKGFDLLIEAFAAVAARRPQATLTIFGEGGERAALERRREELGLSERVLMPGVISDLPSRMAEYDFFVCSSHHESFGNVICEAMAAGLPALSFNCPWGPAEIIRDGVDGLLIAPGDTAALSASMLRLLADSEFRQTLGRNAREITVRLGLPRVLANWDSCFADCRAALGLAAEVSSAPAGLVSQ